LPVYLRDPGQALSLEVPSGLLEAESPECAALRELAEETGLRLSSVVHVFTGYLAPTLLSQRMHLYVADVDAGVAGAAEPDDGEDLEVVELSMTAVVQLIASGEIRDAKTVLLIQHAQLMGLLEPRSRQTGAT
jgi:8-oxo-dGTP pyrophosphatase MutT (NUDIX family)